MKTIRLLNDDIWENYQYFIKSLMILDRAITGNVLLGTTTTKSDYKVINGLIQRKLRRNHKRNRYKFPVYIEELFGVFCNDRRKVTFDVEYLEHYPLLKEQFISKGNAQMLAFQNIVSIYNNCQCITTRKCYGSAKIDIDEQYLLSLLEEISDIKCIRLNAIKIINPDINQSVMQNYKQFQIKFGKQNWSLHNVEKHQYLGKERSILILSKITYNHDCILHLL